MAAALIQRRNRVLSLLGLAFLAEENKEVPKTRNRQQYMREWIARR